MLITVLTVLALQEVAPAPPRPAPDVPAEVIEGPSWVRHPGINFNRPTRDRSGGPPTGRVVVRCMATVEGRLEDCTVISDSSASNRLSPYALRAADDAMIRPRRVNGQPVATSVQFAVGVDPQ